MSKIFRIPALMLALLAAPLALGCDVEDDDDEKSVRDDDKPAPDEIAGGDEEDEDEADEDGDEADDCKVAGNLPPNQPDPDGAIKACP